MAGTAVNKIRRGEADRFPALFSGDDMNEKKKSRAVRLRRELPFHLMLLPAVILVGIFSYGPMVGIIMAFEKFSPKKGMSVMEMSHRSKVYDNIIKEAEQDLRDLMNIPDIDKVVFNTFFIAAMKLALGVVVPMFVAILLNEVRLESVKKVIQTMVYFPHFLSWVILSGIFIDILSPSTGIVNEFITMLGFEPVYFLGDPKVFPYTMALTETWKEFGFGTIVYLATISGIDPTLYEAAEVDGAGRWQQTVHITLAALLPMAALMLILNLGGVLNLSFEQIYNLYSPQVYSTGDILDTLVYRLGMIDAQYGVATAVGLFKSVVSLVLVSFSYWFAGKVSGYRVF